MYNWKIEYLAEMYARSTLELARKNFRFYKTYDYPTLARGALQDIVNLQGILENHDLHVAEQTELLVDYLAKYCTTIL